MQLNFVRSFRSWTSERRLHVIGRKSCDAVEYNTVELYGFRVKWGYFLGVIYECSSFFVLLFLQGFGAQLFSSPFVPTVEEPVEICYIIESRITEEVNQIDFKDNKHFKQSSRDSGNYSYDDNTSQSKGSEETLGNDIL